VQLGGEHIIRAKTGGGGGRRKPRQSKLRIALPSTEAQIWNLKVDLVLGEYEKERQREGKHVNYRTLHRRTGGGGGASEIGTGFEK